MTGDAAESIAVWFSFSWADGLPFPYRGLTLSQTRLFAAALCAAKCKAMPPGHAVEARRKGGFP
jgi:hypothetical protein